MKAHGRTMNARGLPTALGGTDVVSAASPVGRHQPHEPREGIHLRKGDTQTTFPLGRRWGWSTHCRHRRPGTTQPLWDWQSRVFLALGCQHWGWYHCTPPLACDGGRGSAGDISSMHRDLSVHVRLRVHILVETQDSQLPPLVGGSGWWTCVVSSCLPLDSGLQDPVLELTHLLS